MFEGSFYAGIVKTQKLSFILCLESITIAVDLFPSPMSETNENL